MKSSSVYALTSAVAAVSAHMEMNFPAPFRSKFNPLSVPAAIDYTMTAPLFPDGSNFPCKGYQADYDTPAGAATASFAAGQAANISIVGGANHGGGSCQISLSYDRGQSFTVLQSFEGGCPPGPTTLDFSIPSDAPGGDALLAWTWFNRLGNREMYMNCAHIKVTKGSGGAPKRATNAPLKSRPGLFVANVGNGCSTVDSQDVQFPRPGPDVAFGNSGAVPPQGGGCENGFAGYAVAGKQAAGSGSNHDNSNDSNLTPASAVADVVAAKPADPAPAPAAPAAPAPAAPATAVLAASGASDAMAAGTSCATEGRWICVTGGNSFQRCASGQWSVVQGMAAGTVCREGQTDNLEVLAASAAPPLRQLRRGRRAD